MGSANLEDHACSRKLNQWRIGLIGKSGVTAGPATLAIGAEPTLLAGAAIAAVTITAMTLNRDVRRLDHEPQPTPAPTG